MNDWEKFLERRKANIGFITRGKAFREPTPAEMAQAIRIETAAWQWSKDLKPYKVSAEYSVPKGHGINLMATRVFLEPTKGPERDKAIEAYIKTPMDAGPKIDVEVYKWREIGIIRAFISWIMGRKVRRKFED